MHNTRHREPKDGGGDKPASGSLLHSWFLYLTAFTCGFVVLSLEVLGFRLFAPYFGYSVYVSGSLITIVLVALSAGCYLGGRLADAKPRLGVLFGWLVGGTVYLSVIGCTYTVLLSRFGMMSPVVGSVVGSAIIFGFPMVVFSMVSPFLVKVLVKQGDPQHVGRTVGTVSAVSTAGSIVGTVATTFVLIPELGSRTTMLICIGSMYVLATGYYIGRKILRGALLLLLPLATGGVFHLMHVRDPQIVFEKESVYNTVMVRTQGPDYALILNDVQNTQSIFTTNRQPGSVITWRYHDLLSVTPVLADGTNVLILGMGGGTVANQMARMYHANVEAVEIDPVVVEAAEKHFGIRRFNPNITVHVADARTFLARSTATYDAIIVDMYQGGAYIPFYVATKEFFRDAKQRLATHGVLVMNVLVDPFDPGSPDDGLFHSIGNTIADEYSDVYQIRNNDIKGNGLLFAAKSPLELSTIRHVLMVNPYSADNDNARICAYTMASITNYTRHHGFDVFTDDKAPIEKMTYRLMRKVMQKWQTQSRVP